MLKHSLVTLALLAFPLAAHHQFDSEYDANKPITLTGKVQNVSWKDPHMTFMMDAQGGSWTVEGASPATLKKADKFTDKELKDGETVTVEGFRAKDGSMKVSGRSMTIKGKTYTIADAKEDGGPTPATADRKAKK